MGNDEDSSAEEQSGTARGVVHARSAAQENDLGMAQAQGKRAEQVLETLTTVGDHNAHGQLALEHLLVAIRSLPLPSREEVHP